jgi:hypothetical protein
MIIRPYGQAARHPQASSGNSRASAPTRPFSIHPAHVIQSFPVHEEAFSLFYLESKVQPEKKQKK